MKNSSKFKALKLFGQTTLVAVSFAVWSGSVQAALITSLHNTGVGAGFTDDAVDIHWTVRGPSAGTFSPTYAITSATIPENTNWTGSGDHTDNISAWISPSTGPSTSQAAGDYTYRTSFDLTGFDLNSVIIQGRWEADNKLQSIILNGNAFTISENTNNNSFNGVLNQPNWNTSPSEKNFDLADFIPYFVAGVNTLDFVVNNTTVSTTGLRVQFTTATANNIPEPVSLALMSIGVAGLCAMRRRQNLA